MKRQAYSNFSIENLNIVITGAGGVLCGAMARELASLGARIAVIDIRGDKAQETVSQIAASGGDAYAITCDVTEPGSVKNALKFVRERWDRVDVLINGAGGNHPSATSNQDVSFFNLEYKAVQKVLDLNFLGTFLPCQVFGKLMADNGKGIIVNIASMNSVRPLTRIPAYSAGKAAVANFTKWLAVHMAQEYGPDIRVNAIAPGFFLTEQVRYLLIDPKTGGYTERGERIIVHTPMKRMGLPADLLGTLVWLISPASAFVTGIMVPVDGGFSAYAGV
ncbi:MAG TPA: SDR family oxidoreductase [Cyclobacteriaceae bacterium]|nr:SDR family oxidoreductase [Cyclobacteriaceae bacterium]